MSHLDQLGDYTAEHDGIIFDDMSFEHHPRTSQIAIVDMEQPRAIHIRYKTAKIPKKVRKVFLSNVDSILDLNDGAIKRRVEVFRIKKKSDGTYHTSCTSTTD